MYAVSYTHLDVYKRQDQPVTVFPMKAFPVIKDLVTDVSWNYKVNKKIPPFQPRPGVEWKMYQPDVDRVQEFRKCIECFLCQDVCHIIRSHDLSERFYGPRFFVRVASLEMHPKDVLDRREQTREQGGLGYCNITKCCTCLLYTSRQFPREAPCECDALLPDLS